MILPAGSLKVKKTNTKILTLDGNKQLFNDLKLKVNAGGVADRNKTPSKGMMEKLRGSRRSVVPTLKES